MTSQFAARFLPDLPALRPSPRPQTRLIPIQRRNRNPELAYFITPKSGPVRPLQTLRDASSALLDDISSKCRRQPHWMRAGRLVLIACETVAADDVQAATDALLNALVTEGWMSYANDKPRKHQG
ncbi:MAG: hypothetical protein R3D62_01315 [Xanthobacteraceae bacterium]